MVVRTGDLTRLERESLVANGFLAPVVQGWYMPTKPGEADGDSTSWYAAAPDFIGGYCDARFGERWCVSADLSVRLHTGQTSFLNP